MNTVQGEARAVLARIKSWKQTDELGSRRRAARDVLTKIAAAKLAFLQAIASVNNIKSDVTEETRKGNKRISQRLARLSKRMEEAGTPEQVAKLLALSMDRVGSVAPDAREAPSLLL